MIDINVGNAFQLVGIAYIVYQLLSIVMLSGVLVAFFYVLYRCVTAPFSMLCNYICCCFHRGRNSVSTIEEP